MKKANGNKETRHSITAIVSKEEKEQIEQEARERGCGQQDIVRERVFGRGPRQVLDRVHPVEGSRTPMSRRERSGAGKLA